MSVSYSPNPLPGPEDTEVDVTLPRADIAQLHTLFESLLAQESPQSLTCPKCGTQHLHGELACANCGIIFSNGGKTDQLNTTNIVLEQSKTRSIGEVFTKENSPIFLEIDGKCIQLPDQDSIVLGRSSSLSDAPKPDIALNEFGAGEKGVSRQHVRITRHGNIVYVADMGSSNGTFLNGRPILRNHNRILRSGDELKLGFLKLVVQF